MIVPSRRFIFLFVLAGIPALTLLGLVGGLGTAAGFGLLALLVLALVVLVVDALGAGRALSQIEASLPEVLRARKGQEVELPLLVSHPKGSKRTVTVGLAFPRGVSPEPDLLELPLLAGATRTLAPWIVTAEERGSFEFSEIYLEVRSPFGLWGRRKTVPCNTELRVYPDLMADKGTLAPLLLKKGGLGVHVQRQLGKGREFEQLREYAPGDSYEDIYWKGTARRRLPITKTYQIERTQEVYVVIDRSRRSARQLAWDAEEGTAGFAKTQIERFIQSALVLALAAGGQGDHFGLITFSEQVDTFIPARSGSGHFNVCRDALYALEAEMVSPDFEELAIWIGARIRQRSLLIFLTDLGDPMLAESFLAAIPQVARRHVLLVHSLGMPGVEPLFVRGDEVEKVGEIYTRLAGHLLWSDGQAIGKKLRPLGVSYTSSEKERLAASVVSDYLNVKRRQLI